MKAFGLAVLIVVMIPLAIWVGYLVFMNVKEWW